MRGFRLGILVVLVALLASACTSSEPDTPPTGEAERSSTTTASPTTDPTGPDAEGDEGDDSPDAPDDPDARSADLDELPGRLLLRTSTGAIVITTPSGELIEELAPGETNLNTQPTWSPTGDNAAWSTVSPDGGSLSVWSRTAGVIEIDVLPPPFFYYFSPGGDTLATLRPGPTGVELGLVDATATYMPIDSAQPFYFDWNTDGSWLIAALGGRVLGRLLIDAPDRNARTLEPFDLGGRILSVFQAPDSTRNGRVLVPLAGEDGQGFDLVALDPVSGLLDGVVRGEGVVFATASPGGDRVAVLSGVGVAPEDDVQLIAFQGNVDLQAGDLAVVDTASGEVEILPQRNILMTSWSPDGARLALLQAQTDGFRWIFWSDENTVVGPSYVPSAEFGQSYLPFADQYTKSQTWWSPDGTAFVFAGRFDGRSGIFVDVIDDDLDPVFVSDGDIVSWSFG